MNDVVEDQSAKKTKSLTSSKSTTLQPDATKTSSNTPSKTPKAPSSDTSRVRSVYVVEDQSAKKTKSLTSSKSTTPQPDATKTSSNSPSKTPKAPGSDTSRARSVSRPGSNLTPSKPSFEVPTNNTENMAGEDVTKKDAKATMQNTKATMENTKATMENTK